MNLEFVKVTNGYTKKSVEDIFEFEIPDAKDLEGIDTFISSQFNLTSGNIIFPYELSEWIEEHPEYVEDPNTYKQLPYGCMQIKYTSFVSKNAKKKQKIYAKSYAKKYPFAQALLDVNTAKVFFGLDKDKILFNLYILNDKKPEEIYPNIIFKIDLDKIINMRSFDNHIFGDAYELSNDDFEFIGITRESYNALDLMNKISGAMMKMDISKLNNILWYIHGHAKACIYCYMYFMLKLKQYKISKPKKSKIIKTTDNMEFNDDVTQVVIENNDDKPSYQVIYLSKYDYLASTDGKSNLGEDVIERKSKAGYHIKHEFPVRGSEYYNKWGTHVVRKSYVKGKGLPPLKKTQKIYVDGKKGDTNESKPNDSKSNKTDG